MSSQIGFYLSRIILGVEWPEPCSVHQRQTVRHDLLPGLGERLAATLRCQCKVKTIDTLGGLPPAHTPPGERKSSLVVATSKPSGFKKNNNNQSSSAEIPCTAAASRAISTDVMLQRIKTGTDVQQLAAFGCHCAWFLVKNRKETHCFCVRDQVKTVKVKRKRKEKPSYRPTSQEEVEGKPTACSIATWVNVCL